MIRKPPCLRAGDTVAAVSLSSGLAAQLPDRYAAGKRQLEEAFGLKVIEAPNALASNEFLYRHPEARAADLHWALENPDVRAIVSTIGGDDSVKLLPYLDLDLIRAHPTILLGFSDTTVALTAFLRAGVVSFYGASLMTDFAEHGGIRPFVKRGMRRALFESQPFELEAAETWTEEFADWGDPVARNRVRQFEPNEGWVGFRAIRALKGG